MEGNPYFHYPSMSSMSNEQAHFFHPQANMSLVHQTPYEAFAKQPQPIDLINYVTSSPNQASQFAERQSNEQGQVDFDQLITTVGQLASTYHQVSPIVKQLGSLVQLLKP